MKRNSLISCFLLAAISFAALHFAACDRTLFYEENCSVDEEGWDLFSPAEFDVEIDDTTQFYDIYFNLRNSTSYGYANAFFFITTTFPDQSQAFDTLECPLAAPDGEWYGKKGARYVDNRYFFRRCTRFPMVGQYHFSILHGMRDKEVAGLKSVGLRLEKAEPQTIHNSSTEE